MFDIAALEVQSRSESGMPMSIIHPRTKVPVLDEEKNPVTITLLGRNSATFRETQRRIRDRRADRASKAIKATDEDLERDELDLLVAVTIGWTFTVMDGQPFPCNPENARRFWADPRFVWIREQAMSFVLEDGNFLGG